MQCCPEWLDCRESGRDVLHVYGRCLSVECTWSICGRNIHFDLRFWYLRWYVSFFDPFENFGFTKDNQILLPKSTSVRKIKVYFACLRYTSNRCFWFERMCWDNTSASSFVSGTEISRSLKGFVSMREDFLFRAICFCSLWEDVENPLRLLVGLEGLIDNSGPTSVSKNEVTITFSARGLACTARKHLAASGIKLKAFVNCASWTSSFDDVECLKSLAAVGNCCRIKVWRYSAAPGLIAEMGVSSRLGWSG